MTVLPNYFRNGFILLLSVFIIAGCKNSAPFLDYNFENDTIVVDHGKSVDFDLRFIDDRDKLLNAKVIFRGDTLYNANDTIFKFSVETAKLRAGEYAVDMYAVDDKEKEAKKDLDSKGKCNTSHTGSIVNNKYKGNPGKG